MTILQKIATTGTETVAHQRRVAESINNILDFNNDEWRRQTEEEKAAGVTPVSYSYPPLMPDRYARNSSPGVTNMNAAIQTAIDIAKLSGGGVVQFLPRSYGITGITLANGVYLRGVRLTGGASGSSTLVALAGSGSDMVISPATTTDGFGVSGMGFYGLGAGTALVGMRLRECYWATVKDCFFSNFADEALITESSTIACKIQDILAYGCLLDRTRAAKSGVFDIGGTDHFVDKLELTASTDTEGDLTDANARCGALVVRGSVNTFSHIIAEISDFGIYVASGTQTNRFVECRADLNYGNGWEIHGGGQYDTCLALRNGRASTNTYDGFVVSGASNVTMDNCSAESLVGGEPVHRYGFNDDQASDANKNRYSDTCVSTGHGTRSFNTSGTSSASVIVPHGPVKTFTANDATPSVDGYGSFLTANSGATTITAFDDGVDGQAIEIQAGDANTTIQHNGTTIATTTGSDVSLTSGRVYAFKNIGGVWRMLYA